MTKDASKLTLKHTPAQKEPGPLNKILECFGFSGRWVDSKTESRCSPESRVGEKSNGALSPHKPVERRAAHGRQANVQRWFPSERTLGWNGLQNLTLESLQYNANHNHKTPSPQPYISPPPSLRPFSIGQFTNLSSPLEALITRILVSKHLL